MNQIMIANTTIESLTCQDDIDIRYIPRAFLSLTSVSLEVKFDDQVKCLVACPNIVQLNLRYYKCDVGMGLQNLLDHHANAKNFTKIIVVGSVGCSHLRSIAANCPNIEHLDLDLDYCQVFCNQLVPCKEYFNYLKVLKLKDYILCNDAKEKLLDFFLLSSPKLEYFQHNWKVSWDAYLLRVLRVNPLQHLKTLKLKLVTISYETVRMLTDLPNIEMMNTHEWGLEDHEYWQLETEARVNNIDINYKCNFK